MLVKKITKKLRGIAFAARKIKQDFMEQNFCKISIYFPRKLISLTDWDF